MATRLAGAAGGSDAREEDARPLLAYGTATLADVGATDHPEARAGAVARATFSWLAPLLRRGAAAPLQPGDLWNVREHDDAERVADALRTAIRACVAEGDATPRALWRAIHRAFGFNMYLAGLCKLLGDALGFVGPICINALIKYVEDASSAWFWPQYYGYILSAALFSATVCQSLCLHQHHHLVIREAIRVRSAVTMVVHEKALALSSQTKSQLGSGHILNLATTDANRLLDLFYFIHYTWAAPLQIVVGMFLLVRFLGYAAFAGVAVMVVLVPLSALLSAQAAKISKKLIACTDKRLKFLNEVLRHVRIIKFYAWEVEMLGQVEFIRESELGFLRRMVFWNSFSQVALQAGPILVSLASFAVYSWIQSEPLSADAAFTSITLFSIFRLPLMMLPRIFSLVFQAHVSVERLAKYFAVKEHTTTGSPQPQLQVPAVQSPPKYEIDGATFGWNGSTHANDTPLAATTAMLTDVSISIPTGKLTIIVGPVGSGKSTLLAALLNELKPTSGQVRMPTNQVSYAAQTPYLVNASIEDNITFGGPRDVSRLRRVIESCELQSDLDMLPDGIQTELGENGINLSGGQKQRVSIARAAYPASQQMYIFDDALSALDAKVSTNIFKRCFSESPGALLAGKTRVLATHSLQFAKSAQWIIVMDKMRVVQMGTYEDLTKKQRDGPFAKLLDSFNGAQSTADQEEAAVAKRKKSMELDEATKDEGREAAPAKRLVGDESRAEGSVSSDVFFSYFKSCGAALCFGAFIVLVSAQVSQVSTDLWLTRWTSAPATSASELSYYLTIYAYLSLVTIGLGFCGDLSSRLAGLSASRVIHHRLLRHVIKGTMRFFDTTPIGRVLNRFSNDMNTIDQKLNANVISFTTMLLSLASILIIQTTSVPLLLVVLLPVFGLYYLVQLYYRMSCRELQRLDSISKSPIYAHFTETLNGIVTIRAFQMVPKTLRDQAFRINQNTKACLSLTLINRWLGVRLESLGALIILGVACFVSREHAVMSSAMAGLLLSYSQSMSGLLNWIVRSNIDMENAMNSIERTDEYCHVDVEPLALEDSPFGSNSSKSHYLKDRPEWPEHGEVVFKGVQVKYHSESDLVLRDVSFSIKGGEKVGICGRTGAGKSSLLLTLFRLVPTHAGRITIDGIDTSQIDLSELRSRMAIIPQEPVLFATTIRFNLDPTGALDDATLWSAIRKSHLHDFVCRLPGQLDAEVLEAGENFSLGERQLICLARAILRDSKILCLDEATASMDHNTDMVIQASIRREFASATVLTIAHRVQTIIDYDKIMVLKQGRVAEYGPPKQLLAITGGELASMYLVPDIRAAPNEESLTDSTRADNYLFMAMHRRHQRRIVPMDAQEVDNLRARNADGSFLWGDYVDGLVIQPPPDVRVLNLETAVTETTTNKDIPRKGINYHMHSKNISPVFTRFASATFDAHGVARVGDRPSARRSVPYVISFANNHAMDFGRVAFERESLATFSDFPGEAQVTGAGMTLTDAERAARVHLQDRGDLERRSVCVLAVTTVGAGTPFSWGATSKRSGMVCLPSITSDNGVDQAIDMITHALRTNGFDPARRPYDSVVVLSIHWGPNWAYRSSLRDDLDFQRCRQQLAHRIIRELGVDLIYGHSSHHIRGLEVFDGKLIIYGAGDLINDYEGFENPGDEAYNTLGALFVVDVSSSDGSLASLRLIPTTMDGLQLKRVKNETLSRWRPRRERREDQHDVISSLAKTINKYSRWDVGDHGRGVRLRVVEEDSQVPGGPILMYP